MRSFVMWVGRDLVMGAAGLCVAMSLGTGCKASFDMEVRDDLLGTWELQEVDGLGECAIQAGDIDVLSDGDAMSGEFWWTADCAHVGAIDELAAIDEVIVDVEGSQYQLVFAAPGGESLGEPREWDCIIDGPDLDCIEIAGEEVILYSFLFISR